MNTLYIYSFYSFLLIFCFCSTGGETTLQIEQTNKNTKEAITTAIQQVSLKLMENFINPTDLQVKNKQIQKIISSRFNRYILSTHSTPFIKKGDLFSTSVTISFSEANLKQILLQEDLFYSGTSHLRILPFILFRDFVNHEDYAWWIKKESPPYLIKKQMGKFYHQIQQTLISYGFFVINPELAGSSYFIPDPFKFTQLKKNSVFKLTRFFKSHLVMVGSVTLREANTPVFLNLKTKLKIYHVESSRIVAEIERSFKIPVTKKPKKMQAINIFLKQNPLFSKGLGQQLKSIYEAGQLDSNLLQITVRGDLSYKESHKLITQLVSNIKDIKNLQEHIIQSQSITYITNTMSPVEVIAKEIQNTVFYGLEVHLVKTKKKHIILKVTSKNR